MLLQKQSIKHKIKLVKTNNCKENKGMYKNKIIRFILLIIGFISLGLGIIGIVIPVLPTVPFLLLTSFCFVRSSEKFNKRFLNSKIYKKYLENFQKNKVMTVKSEVILISSVSALLMTSLYFVNNLAMTIVFPLIITFKCAYFVFMVRPVTKEEFIRLKENLRKEVEQDVR